MWLRGCYIKMGEKLGGCSVKGGLIKIKKNPPLGVPPINFRITCMFVTVIKVYRKHCCIVMISQ